MCTPKPPKDNSADIARQQEAERQARITQGQSAIDNAFSGFNDDFYNTYQNDYTNYYNPQLDDQYADARKRLTLQLAKTGNLTGSVGADQMSDLQKYYNTQREAVTNRALSARQDLQGNIDNRLSQLYADNRSAADPGNATSAAASAAQALQPAAPTSPLANTFADFFGNLGNVAAISNANRGYDSTGVQNYGGGSSNNVKYVS